MQKRATLWLIKSAVLIGLLWLHGNAYCQMWLPRKHPSMRVGLVIPGYWQAPTDQEAANVLIQRYGANNATAVRRWEEDHADVAADGPDMNIASIRTTEYIQMQNIDNGNNHFHYCRQNNLEPEDFFLHAREDTFLNDTSIISEARWYRGRFETVAFGTNATSITGLIYQNPPWGTDVLKYGPSGGGIYLASHVPFAEFTITLRSPGQGGGSFVVEYCSQVDSNHAPVEWRPVTLISDGTNGLTQSGTVKWVPPADWKWFTRDRIDTRYAIRIRATGYTQYPIVDDITTRRAWVITNGVRRSNVVSATANTVRLEGKYDPYSDNYYRNMIVRVVSGPGAGQTRNVVSSSRTTLTVDSNWETIPTTASVVEVEGPSLKIPGWDPANDRNGDGYVDDTEFANLVNPNATARMRWESRLPVTWYTAAYVRYRANLWNPVVLAYWIDQLNRWRTQNGISGFYNDNVFDTLGRYNVIQGGALWEYTAGKLGEPPTNAAYDSLFAQMFVNVRQATNLPFVGGNTSSYNLLDNDLGRQCLNSFTWALMEDVLFDSETLYGFALRKYRILAYIARGVVPMVFGHVKWGVVEKVGNTREMWEFALTNLLAMHYLLQVPDQYVAVFWNRTFTYGSGLTTVSTSSYWKAGVPKNMAYIPVGLLSADIGVPANTIPTGYQPFAFMDWIPINGVTNSYYAVADSTSSTAYVGDWAPDTGGDIPVVPTYIFYLYRDGVGKSTSRHVWPAEAVLARMYTRGMVVYRTVWATPSNYATYVSSVLTVPLPGVYRRVNWDGTLGPPITEISLRGFEGAILVAASQTSHPNVQLTLSVDKQNPKPLDVVTVTITAANTGNAEARDVEIRVPLSNATYEQGSLTPSGLEVDSSIPSVLRIRVPSLPVGGNTNIRFRMVIR
jgi:uncharacterized repeat protein (TIGR01451 family)